MALKVYNQFTSSMLDNMSFRFTQNRGAFHSQKISYTFGKNPFAFKKNPSKIRINPFVLKKSRTPFPISELPLAQNSFPTADSLLEKPEVSTVTYVGICPKR